MMGHHESKAEEIRPPFFALLLFLCTTASAIAFFTVCEAMQSTPPLLPAIARATALLSLLFLQIAACSAPLSRLHKTFYPLYRHRPLVVSAAFLLGLLSLAIVAAGEHGILLTGVLTEYANALQQLPSMKISIRELPFEGFGLLALLASGIVAATGHNYWRGRLGVGWHGVQMLVYPAYASSMAAFALGVYQVESNAIYASLLIAGPLLFALLILAALLFPQRDGLVESTGGTPPVGTRGRSALALVLGDGAPSVPAGTASVLVLSVVIMGGLACALPDFATGHADSSPRTLLHGIYSSTPVPSIYLSPNWSEDARVGQYVLLCGVGRQGVPSAWAQFDGQRVTVEGAIRYRGTVAMLEMDAASPPLASGDAPTSPPPAPQALGGPINVRGELVSTKCYLGGSWPSSGKLHRRCAIACLKGGVPPGVLTGSGIQERIIFLTGPDAANLDETMTGWNIDVEGMLFTYQGYSYLEVLSLRRHNAE